MLDCRLSILIVVFLALPSPAKALPTAQYNPATGGIRFTGMVNVQDAYIVSTESPLILANALGPNPQYGVDNYRLRWTDAPATLPLTFFGGNVIQPGQAANKVHFSYYAIGARDVFSGPLQLVPEPTAIALTTSAVIAGSLLRRRQLGLGAWESTQ